MSVQTFRTYLRIQATVFVFGIVGPVFLIIYFAVQPDPTIKWMYYWGLVITAVDILVALQMTQSAIAERTPARGNADNTDEAT